MYFIKSISWLSWFYVRLIFPWSAPIHNPRFDTISRTILIRGKSRLDPNDQTMCITNRTKFKGEVENYLRNCHSSFDSKLFDLFNIKDDFQPYLGSLTQALKASTPIIECETW